MRFIGNKESICRDIIQLLDDKGLTGSDYTFFDAFCGTGSVSNAVKDRYKVIVNDSMHWCSVYSQGRLFANQCTFSGLEFDPFDYLNSHNDIIHGFMYTNYSPAESDRMYFSAYNAGRIDYFRSQIETWKMDGRINTNEYYYLLACLIEAVSSVSNTAGVYGAFLKKWDARALKDITFSRMFIDDKPCKAVVSLSAKVEDIISDVECDILYLDPPYTQNQYGTQYHLLETLILNDNPSISKITGSRPTTPMRSDWSREYKANILFEQIVATTKARYILLSYNNDGFMSKDYIEAVLKRHGIADTYECRKISYKKYQNWKTTSTDQHYEYLFFVEKKPALEVVYDCPLNYVGSKAKLIPFIRMHMPKNYEMVSDIFGGGFNVGMNIGVNGLLYNDINCFVTGLLRSFAEIDTYSYLLRIKQYTKKFGLEKGNAESYYAARKYYNSKEPSKRDPQLLYTIILYGFQQQIRFNTDHEFNNPVGNRWFNDKVLEKFISFSRALKGRNCAFLSKDFRDMIDEIPFNSFVYLDPPYRLTCGTYNDGKRGFEGWTKIHEKALFAFIDELTNRGISCMLSYVKGNNGKQNEQLIEWLESRKYTVLDIPDCQGRYAQRKEIIVINYEE